MLMQYESLLNSYLLHLCEWFVLSSGPTSTGSAWTTPSLLCGGSITFPSVIQFSPSSCQLCAYWCSTSTSWLCSSWRNSSYQARQCWTSLSYWRQSSLSWCRQSSLSYWRQSSLSYWRQSSLCCISWNASTSEPGSCSCYYICICTTCWSCFCTSCSIWKCSCFCNRSSCYFCTKSCYSI